jgi:translation elongation factor P/translation initiation factor 5A
MQQLTGADYLAAIQAEMKKPGKVRAAVAFWATDSEKIFDGRKKEDVQILCDLSMGGSRASTIRRLRKDYGAKQVDSLHAKVMIFESALIIGSANASTSALGDLVEKSRKALAKHVEYGVLISDANEIAKATLWFDALFNEKGEEITDDDLVILEMKNKTSREAKHKIEKMRVPYKGNPMSILDRVRFNPGAFKGVSFVFVETRLNASDADTAEEYLELQKQSVGIDQPEVKAKDLAEVNVRNDCFFFDDTENFSDDIIEFWMPDGHSDLRVFFRKRVQLDKEGIVYTRKAANEVKSSLDIVGKKPTLEGAEFADQKLAKKIIGLYGNKAFPDASSLKLAIEKLGQ